MLKNITLVESVCSASVSSYSNSIITKSLRQPLRLSLRFGVDCQTVESSADTVVPAYSETRRHCIFQSDLLLFSCAGAHQSLQRVCPCRDYMKGQVALCKDCL